MRCTIHPYHQADQLCAECKKPFCKACLSRENGTWLCSRCRLTEQDSVNISSPLTVATFPISIPHKKKHRSE